MSYEKQTKIYNGSRWISVNNVIPDSVVSRYRLNEGSGTTATDSVGNNNGTISGASYVTASKEGSHALSFNGAGDDVDLNWVGPYGDDTFWIACWAKFDDPTNLNNTVVGNYTGSFPQVKISNDSSGNVRFRLHDSQGNEVYITTSISADTWYHFVGVRDGDTIRFYKDGSEVSGSPSSNSNVVSDMTNGNVHLGERPDGGEDLAGDIDDVMFGNQAITDQQVSDIYNMY